jgi:DNA invertase Pin-like site-specific DNA recombinase
VFTKPAQGPEVASFNTAAWYTDFISGTSTLERSGLRQSLPNAQMDRFDVLLVYRISRFSRNRADAIRYMTALKKLG